MDDRESLRAYVENRDERAFASLVERHLALVYSAALRQTNGDAAGAQEVTQMVFIELARKARSLISHPVLVGWLHRTTRWKAAELRRNDRRRQNLEQRAGEDWKTREGIADDGAPVVRSAPLPGDETLDWEKVGPILDEMVDELSVQDREAVLLRFFANWPFAQIGTSLGLSENAARMRVERALEKLRAALAKRGVKSSVVLLGGALSAQAAVPAPPAVLSAVVKSGLCAGAALPGAAVATTGGLLFMAKVQIAGTSALALLLAGGVWWQWSDNRERSEVWRAVAETASAVHVVAPAPLPAADAAPASSAIGSPPGASGVTGLTEAQLERARLDLLVRRGELDATHASLFRALKLSAAEVDQLKTLIVERNQAEFDAAKFAQARGLEFASAAERARVLNAAASEIDERITRMLGGERFAQFRTYQETLSLRGEISTALQAVKTLSVADDTLLDAVVEQFVADRPDYGELVFRRDRVAIGEHIERIFGELKDPELVALAGGAHSRAKVAQDFEMLLREAALKGKLQNLSRQSARDYGVPQNAAPDEDDARRNPAPRAVRAP